jgi:hypothetical protein
MKNGKGGSGLVREERLQIMMSPEELKAVDNFRFHHRMPSRAARVEGPQKRGVTAPHRGSQMRLCWIAPVFIREQVEPVPTAALRAGVSD